MNAHLFRETQAAHAVGRAVARHEGRAAGSVASMAVERRLTRLLFVTAGMFVTAVSAVVIVGIQLFG